MFSGCSLGRQLRNVDEHGRKFMCERTLPSFLISFKTLEGKTPPLKLIIFCLTKIQPQIRQKNCGAL